MHGHPEYTPDPGAVIRMPPMPQPPPSRRGPLIAMFAIAVLLALVIGVAIGRATVEAPTAATPAAPAETSNRGKLKVVSVPAEGTVTLDGRFVGVAPLENLDVDPGKHAIVIDVFGYQPYAGIVEVEPRGAAKLSVVLAPLGGTETTTGNVSGGTATRVTVPRSALLPGTGGGGPIDPYPTTPSKVPAKPDPPRAPAYVPPPRPRRDCNGENRTCRDGCYRADSDCRFSCPGCTSCLSSVGWDECKRQCDSCRNNCEQNKKFCESSCQSQLSICESSQ